MHIQDAYTASVNKTKALSQFDPFKTQKTQENKALPTAWGSDRVTISAEARAAAEAASTVSTPSDLQAKENTAFTTGAAQADVEAEQTATDKSTGAGAEFAAYMEKSKSKAQDSNPEERLKDLQSKLKSLQSQLTSVASADKDQTGQESKIESINSQITAVMQEIAELTSQMAEEALKA